MQVVCSSAGAFSLVPRSTLVACLMTEFRGNYVEEQYFEERKNTISQSPSGRAEIARLVAEAEVMVAKLEAMQDRPSPVRRAHLLIMTLATVLGALATEAAGEIRILRLLGPPELGILAVFVLVAFSSYIVGVHVYSMLRSDWSRRRRYEHSLQRAIESELETLRGGL